MVDECSDAAARVARSARRGFVVECVSRGEGSAEAVHGIPGQRLRDYAGNYRGYRNERGGSARLRMVPSTRVTLDLSFGALPRLGDSRAVPAGAFYGMRTRPLALLRSDGPGVLVELSPLGAYAVLGVPLWEMTDTVIDWSDVLGRSSRVVARLAETPVVEERLALLDDVLAALVAAGPTPAPQVVWAWQRLCRAGGRVPIAGLAEEVGWTRRHLLTRFREQIGLSPKTAARVIRLQRAMRLLYAPGRRRCLAAIALATGYSDQAHLTREFRALTGATPVELAALSPC